MSTVNAEVLQRWNEWIRESFVTKTEAAKAFGEDFSNFQRILLGKRSISSNTRLKAQSMGLNLDWLETGKGTMGTLTGEGSKVTYVKDKVQKYTSGDSVEILSESDVVYIPYYERRVNAGMGIDIDNSTEYRALILRSSVPHPERSFAIKVNGDSMIAAGITENSLVICERIDEGSIELYVGKIVIAGYEGAAYIKRLVKKGSRYYLHSECIPKDKYPDLDLNPQAEWKLLAVVVFYKTTA